MKTKPKHPTRSKTARHSGRADNDTNKQRTYQIGFSYLQRGVRFIVARSSVEAREKARLIPMTEEGFWKPHDWPESYTVEEIDFVELGKIPENASILRIPDPNKPGSEPRQP